MNMFTIAKELNSIRGTMSSIFVSNFFRVTRGARLWVVSMRVGSDLGIQSRLSPEECERWYNVRVNSKTAWCKDRF